MGRIANIETWCLMEGRIEGSEIPIRPRPSIPIFQESFITDSIKASDFRFDLIVERNLK